ncbi:hypothetical protein KA005_10040, partial [bacterium]|nr:hypothetical protein [bacterium]
GGLDTVEEIGQTVIDYATAKAIASDNPIVMEKVRVDSDLRKYEAMQAGWKDQRYETEKQIELSKTYLDMHERQLDDIKEDVKAKEPKPEDKDFSVKFFKNEDLGIEKEITYTDKKEAGKQLVKLFSKEFERFTKGKFLSEDISTPLFSYRGFDLKFRQFLDLE